MCALGIKCSRSRIRTPIAARTAAEADMEAEAERAERRRALRLYTPRSPPCCALRLYTPACALAAAPAPSASRRTRPRPHACSPARLLGERVVHLAPAVPPAQLPPLVPRREERERRVLQAPQQRRGRLARARLKHGLVLVPRALACLRLAGGAREGVSQLARADGGRGRCVFRVARPSRAGGRRREQLW